MKCMIKNLIAMFSLLIRVVSATIDINMSELKYLADHLQPEECRRLVAALHFNAYNQPSGLDVAENNVPEDIPCLNLLLHWNSSKGEGLGQTHELLFRRLHQIERNDLAQWLGNKVFHELGVDLENSIHHPFKFLLQETTEQSVVYNPPTTATFTNEAWTPFDTICYVVLLSLCALTVVVLVQSIYVYYKKQKPKKKRDSKSKKKQKDYEQMERGEIVNSDSESEDQFDIRRKDDPGLKLLGV